MKKILIAIAALAATPVLAQPVPTILPNPTQAEGTAPRPERGRRAFGNGGPPDVDAPPLRIIRARRYAVKPMSVDEAALEVGPSDEAFLVFRNASTDTINVLYRRPDGNLGLIEPEA